MPSVALGFKELFRNGKSAASISIEQRSFDPRNQRTMPPNFPTEVLSELDVESDKSARSLCRGVNAGRVVIFRLILLKGLWLALD